MLFIKHFVTMKNITRLSIWPELKKLGFIPIRFRAHGRIVAIGAALQQDHIDISNKPFKSDIICIEPHSFEHYKECYHITGEIKTPFYDFHFIVDGIGRKKKVTYLKDRINEYYSARKILETVQLMLKEPG